MGVSRGKRANNEGQSTCRIFNIVYMGDSKDAECHTPELRDELLKIECEKSEFGYVNANSGNYIQTICLILNKDTRYDGEAFC